MAGPDPSPRPPARDGEGEKAPVCSPSPLRGGGWGEGFCPVVLAIASVIVASRSGDVIASGPGPTACARRLHSGPSAGPLPPTPAPQGYARPGPRDGRRPARTGHQPAPHPSLAV